MAGGGGGGAGGAAGAGRGGPAGAARGALGAELAAWGAAFAEREGRAPRPGEVPAGFRERCRELMAPAGPLAAPSPRDGGAPGSPGGSESGSHISATPQKPARAGLQVGLSSLSPPPGLFLGRPAGCTAGRTPPPAVASRAAVDLARGGGGALPTELLTTPERTLGDGAAASKGGAGGARGSLANRISWHDHSKKVPMYSSVAHVQPTGRLSGIMSRLRSLPPEIPPPEGGGGEEGDGWEGGGSPRANVLAACSGEAERGPASHGGAIGGPGGVAPGGEPPLPGAKRARVGGPISTNFVKMNLQKGRFGRKKFVNRYHKYSRHKKRWKAPGADDKDAAGDVLFDYGDLPDEADTGGVVAGGEQGGEEGAGKSCSEAEGAEPDREPAATAGPCAGAAGAEVCPGPGGIRREALPSLGLVARGARPSDGELRDILEDVFGHASFRPRQLEVVHSVLAGQSLLAVLPTGAGKSLCYQLPALLLHQHAPVLVVSPLLALMADQLSKLPAGLRGAMLGGGQSTKDYFATMDALREGELHVLFMSPEQLTSRRLQFELKALPSPPALACVDEAHCVSEWSHNFRPAFFRIGDILRDVGVKSTLALTATATTRTCCSICEMLNLDMGHTIRVSSMRENLRLETAQAGYSGNTTREQRSVLDLFSPGGRLVESKSAIVYCNFKAEADQVASLLMSNNVTAKSYHSDKHPKEKANVLRLFHNGRLRVVVATVAFGMGLDKGDVDSVVHFGLPRSPEEYVQEVGRAGRDGCEAVCVTLVRPQAFARQRSLAFSDGVEEINVFKLIKKVFEEHDVKATDSRPGIGFLSKTLTGSEFDMREGVIETLLTFLSEKSDLGGRIRFSELKGRKCVLSFYRRPIEEVAKTSRVVEALFAVQPQPLNRKGEHIVDFGALLKKCDLQLSEAEKELQTLHSSRQLHCELKDPAYCFEVLAVPESLRETARSLAKRLAGIEQRQVSRLDILHRALVPGDEVDFADQEPHIRGVLESYFEACEDSAPLPCNISSADSLLLSDVRALVGTNGRRSGEFQRMTPRAIARILHGVSSPAFPASTWGRTPHWGRYETVDFRAVMQAARKAITHVPQDP